MAKHPPTYRTQEMKTLARWIAAGESGSVVGLPGCGRSNLLDFLCHQPQVLHSYLPQAADSIVLIPVDLKNLPANDLSTLYRVILRAFYWVADQFNSNLKEIVNDLYLENRATQDPFLSQSALYELLFAFQAANTRVVLVLNRFDYFCQTAHPGIVNNLRALRDSFKDTLYFIVGMRQETAYLPDPDALGDMYELLDSHICWVGAMVPEDAKNVIHRAISTEEKAPDKTEIDKMLSLTGNFPVLLKAIGYWWLRNHHLPPTEWRDILAAKHSFDYRLTRIWDSLTQEEQFALAAVREWQYELAETPKQGAALNKALKKLSEEHGSVLPHLAAKGVIEPHDGGWRIKGELLDDYVKRVGPSSRGRIRIDAQTEEIYQGLTVLRNLPPLEDKLLRFFIKQPYKRHTYSVLINEIFAADARDEEGEKYVERTRQDLFPLIRNLRKKIEMNTSKPRYIINWPGNPEGGYQFFSEGRPE